MTKPSLTRALTGLILPCFVFAACATADRDMAKNTSVESRQALEAGLVESEAFRQRPQALVVVEKMAVSVARPGVFLPAEGLVGGPFDVLDRADVIRG